MSNPSARRKPRVFSGVQPTNALHIGNYLGAIRRWVQEQDQKENFYCIVDMHAITIPQDPQTLRRKTRELAALYIACGLDPRKSVIFVQSHVREHAECCWIFNCITPIGWLERMTQYKSKAATQESVLTGLLDYPVLMAADILLYDADEVPVGDDQKQHVELTRAIAQRFNALFGETFTVPQPVIPQSGARIRGFDDPTRKMSKSEATNRGHAVLLTDTPDEIRRTIKRAVTDLGREIVFSEAPEKAGVNNLLEIYELFTAHSRPQIEAHFAGKGYGVLKTEVAEVVVEGLRPIRERFDALMADPGELDRILDDGAERARAMAAPKMRQIKERVGFIVR